LASRTTRPAASGGGSPAGRHVAGKAVVAEQCDAAAVERMPMAGGFALGQNNGSVACTWQEAGNLADIGDGLDAQIALEVELH
jgi:hypothetical protein